MAQRPINGAPSRSPVPHAARVVYFPRRMIQRRRSKIAGWGVYATQPINKNKRIVTYDGEKITNAESLKREERYRLDRRIRRLNVLGFDVDEVQGWFFGRPGPPEALGPVLGDVPTPRRAVPAS